MYRFGNNVHFEEAKLVYIGVPKAANSAIKHALLPLLGIEGEFANIHDREKVPFKYIETPKVKALRHDCLVFSSTRNPWDRVVSTYVDKVCRTPIHPPLAKHGFESNMSFPSFVELLAKTPDAGLDIHLRSQHTMLMHDGCFLPHLVLPMERLETLWPFAQDIVERASKIRPLPLSIVNHKPHADYRTFFDDPLAELIRTRYETDASMFGYEC